MLGVSGGISATSANSYFVGLTLEPVIGLNLSYGRNFAKERVLDDGFMVGPTQQGTELPPSPPPTHEASIRKSYFAVGLDLRIFSKIFGKITGVTVNSPATTGAGN
jgi:hypothetical protein